MTATLRYDGPITLGPLLRTVEAHAVPGLEVCDVAARTHTRTVRGGALAVRVEWDAPDPHEPERDADVRDRASSGRATERAGAVRVSAVDRDGPVPVDDGLVRLVRRWLDLDCDTVAVAAHLGLDPVLGPLVSRRPGLRVLGSTDGFETAVMTVLGQQVSLAAARTFGGRLVAALGGPAAGGLRAFPDPADVAAVDAVDLRAVVGLTNARAATVRALAVAVAEGRVRLGLDDDPHAARAGLLALPGIGPWTADYVGLRVFGDRDAYPADDLVLKRALGVTSGREAARVSTAWAPLRAYAVTHLWTEVVYGSRD